MTMLEFIEPQPSSFLIFLLQKLWPGFLKARYGKAFHVDIAPEVFTAFKELKGESALICPNHCSQEDPYVLFEISRRVGERFHFLAARELFGREHSLKQRWLQKVGGYSVERGLADLSAFKSTRQLLSESGNKIVIFPEGEVSHQNEFLMEFESGPEHMALSTMEELCKEHRTGDVYILPLALRYCYSKDIRGEILAVLTRIEMALGEDSSISGSFNNRLKHVYTLLLDALEDAYNLPRGSVDLYSRLNTLREHLILKAEAFLKLELPAGLSQLARIHRLKDVFNQMHWRVKERATRSDYIPFDIARRYYRELIVATELIALGRHSFDHDLNQEEAAELIDVVELQARKKLSLKRPDIVLVGAGQIIEVRDYLHDFGIDKRRGVQALKQELQERLHDRLSSLGHSSYPMT